MSILRITTHVIDCDADGCDARFGDHVELSAASVSAIATRYGWDRDGDRHYCPACVAKQRELQPPRFDATAKAVVVGLHR
jgi:hypothetical protein